MSSKTPQHDASTAENPDAFERFRELTRKLIGVPKKEIDRRAKVYERKKKRSA